MLEMEFEHITEVVTAFGARDIRAETVAQTAVNEARHYLETDAPVGEHLADQLLLPLVLAGGGTFRTSTLSLHSRTNIDVIRQFLDVGDRPSTTRLSDLLEGIARTGGFGTVLLCDEVGLPLALTEAAKSPDLIAAVSSMLISLADRFVAHGAPSPVAAVFRDDTNQSFVHRIFRIGSDRFVLSASAHGLFLPPEVLDPAITKLERVLGDFVSAT
jgi:hypothetical protein